jgi:hypothetical protein
MTGPAAAALAETACRLIVAGEPAAAEPLLTALEAQLAAGGEPLRAGLQPLLFEVRRQAVRLVGARDFARLEGLRRLAGLLIPELAALFSPARSPAPDPEALAARRLVFARPAPGAPRRPWRVVVAASLDFYPGTPGSRRHEIGPLIAAACTGQGWPATFYGRRSFSEAATVAEDCRQMLALCREQSAELLVLQGFEDPGFPAFAAELRAARPGLRIIGIALDPWERRQWPAMTAAVDHLDFLWSHFPALALWQHPAFRDKTLFVPFPHQGLAAGRPLPEPRRLALSFVGGIDHANWHRALWLGALKSAGVVLRHTLTNRASDDQPALVSYDQYLRQLGQSGAVLSFAMRTDGTRIATGRVFEALAAGALLVQEQSADVEAFLTPERHYLSFTTLGDLAALAGRLRSEPEAVAEIRHRGRALFLESYADAAIIGHLEYRLNTEIIK